MSPRFPRHRAGNLKIALNKIVSGSFPAHSSCCRGNLVMHWLARVLSWVTAKELETVQCWLWVPGWRPLHWSLVAQRALWDQPGPGRPLQEET